MGISQHEFDRIKRLAKLEFSDTEQKNIMNELDSVISVISQVKDVDCENIKPLSSVSEQYQRTRDDIARYHDSSEEILINAPKSMILGDESFFVIPKSVKD